MAKHLSVIFLFIFMVPSLTTSAHVATSKNMIEQQKNVESVYHITGPKVVTVHLKTVYLDGFKTEKKIDEPILSMEDFWDNYKGWQLVKQSTSDVYFQKNINDISPVSKAAGIFGISKNHTLTIFNGNPNNDQIIQTFFQLDLDALEAKLHMKLEKGIPVQSKENFKQVMKVLSHYQKGKS